MHLGIDFGTSYTKMAWSDDGRIIDLLGTRRLPTAACFVPGVHRIIYGQAALDIMDPQSTAARFFKLHLKRNHDFTLGNFSLEELLCDFFSYLQRNYLIPPGLQPDSLTLSIPNNFGLEARRMLLHAARSAFAVQAVSLLPEPVAALVGYNASHPGQALNGDLLVIDIGGGTSDFSFLSCSPEQKHLLLESQFQIGQDAFSGSEIDRMILRNILAPAYQMQYGDKLPIRILNEEFSFPDDKYWFYRWMQMAEDIKINLGRYESYHVDYDDFLCGRRLSLDIKTDIFQTAIDPIFSRMKHYWHNEVEKRARSLGLITKGIWNLDAVLLLGGASQTRGLAPLIKELCPGVPVVCSGDPDYQVIQGLCRWQETGGLTGVNLKTVYPFRFYLENKLGEEHTLEEIPFDTANLELDFQGRYKICTVPVDSSFNLAGENDQVLIRVFELAEEDNEVQIPGFMDQSLILQIEAKRDQIGDRISLYLNLAEACLQLDNKDLSGGGQNNRDNIIDRTIKKQRAAYDLISAYKFLDDELVQEYGRHLEEMENQPGTSGEEERETALFKIMSLMQIYRGK